jgi:hypothetical protein
MVTDDASPDVMVRKPMHMPTPRVSTGWDSTGRGTKARGRARL